MKEGKAYIGDEIVEGNKLIAEFDGFRPYSDTKTLGWLCPPGRVNQRYNDTTGLFDEELYFLDSELQYHSSWDWLMPVVEKINTIDNSEYDVVIWRSDCHINDKQQIIFESSIFKRSETLIQIVWGTVVQFITWYNQNKQS